jgi:solute carrier family 34 (sodium-dependent phosphate cotransporter)
VSVVLEKIRITKYFYRWFALLYIALMFFLIPLYIFALSLAGPVALYIGFLPLAAIFLFAVITNVIQRKFPQHLPEILKNWSFLPLWMRSLDPVDR